MRSDFKIWDGFYETFPSRKDASAFADPEITTRISRQVEQEIADVSHGRPVRDVTVFNQYPLPILLAILSAENPISVLDFGGGIGRTYLSVRGTVSYLKNITFHIVEFKGLAMAGQAAFSGDQHVRFVFDLEQAPSRVDVIHVGSSFQYVDDWKCLLQRFARFGPDYIVFGNLLAGDIDPCVTIQNYWGHKIPVRFHNFDDVIGELYSLGYDLVFEAFHEQTILNQRQPLPLDHFPENHRLRYGRNVILKRERR